LAPPAAPSANTVSPLRAQSRREADGIGIAVGAFLLLIFIIAIGNFFIALGLSLVGGVLARIIMWKSRKGAVEKDEAVLQIQARAQQDVYNARKAAWERLSYCPTDQCVVDDETGESRPLHAAHELLVLTPVVSHATSTPA
jgi:predicted lipid-binding transport protein (Tim44 family)